jgi:nucleoid-associated protein YgaU
LGKEAKIGAAVILVLLIAFVTVVVVRLSGSDSDDKQPDSVADRDGEKHKPAGSHEDPLFGEARSRSFGNPPPTVVTPTKPPSFDSNLDKWKLPSEKGEHKGAGSRYTAPNSPPAFATDPSKSPRASRYEDVAADRSSNIDADGAGRFRKNQNELRADSSDMRKSARAGRADSGGAMTTREDFERGESRGNAAAPLPGHRGNSRYDDSSAALLAPTPARETPSRGDSAGRSMPVKPVSRYDDDFPRTSAGSTYDRYDRGDSHRFGNRSGRREDGKYEVQPNDNYSTISKTLYGTSLYYKALADHNRGKFANEDRLQPGELISAPPVEELQKLYPDSCPKASRVETQQSRAALVSSRSSYNRGRSYTVAEGDTLFNIARYELGKASRWAEIYDLNRDVLGKDFNYLTPGMKLVLPENEKADVLTSRPGDTLR